MKKTISINDLTQDDRNANIGTPKGQEIINNSIRDSGMGRSILVDKDGYIIAGNKTMLGAGANGIENVRIVETTGDEVVAVMRTDLDINSPEARRLALADNRSAEINLNWDTDILYEFSSEGVRLDGLFDIGLDEFGLDETGYQNELGGEGNDKNQPKENKKHKYSQKIEAPIYKPSGACPDVSELYNAEKVSSLITDIDLADITTEEKAFLTLAAKRHAVLDFQDIAEYYTHATPIVKKLMEDSALVVIDFNRAIELGYVRMSEAIREIQAQGDISK